MGTKSRETLYGSAIHKLFGVTRDFTGNLPAFPGIFPDNPARAALPDRR